MSFYNPLMGFKKKKKLFCLEKSRRGFNLENMIIIYLIIFSLLVIAFISVISIALLISVSLFKKESLITTASSLLVS